tara:strand:+ start:3268 stop:3996 length:729 start_codon:yes stop_codon:yes gene_type:complete
MKAIILCAGKGKRTGLLYPKCLQKFSDGSSILEKKLEILKKIGFKNENIVFATGFREDLIKKKTNNLFKYVKNKKFNTTNMIFSLNEVLKKIKSDDICVIYADILFQAKDLKKIILSKKKIITLVDTKWLKKWKLKSNFKEDLEELKLKGNRVVAIGKKTNKINNIDGRYVGITKFSKSVVQKFKEKKILKKFLINNRKLDFTTFLMKLINNNFNVYALKKELDWHEFDTKQDFKNYEKDFK